MKILFTPLRVAAFGAALTLGACGLSSEGRQADSIGASIAAKLFKKKSAEVAEPVDLVQIMATTSEPLALLVMESQQITVLIREVAKNGSFSTFHSDEGQALNFDKGVLIATRGGGSDLMSSQIAPSMRLILSEREGSAQRVMTYLTGDGRSIDMPFDCKVLRGKREPFESGDIKTTTQLMVEQCSDGTYEFANTYLVSSGQVLSSRQWINPDIGSVLVQMIRK